MAKDILTPENLARHAQLQARHAHYKKLYDTSRDLLIAAIKPNRMWSQHNHVAVLREHERKTFQQKIFALEYPQLYADFLKASPVFQLIVTVPPVLAPHEVSAAGASHSLIAPDYIDYLIQSHLPPDEALTP